MPVIYGLYFVVQIIERHKNDLFLIIDDKNCLSSCSAVFCKIDVIYFEDSLLYDINHSGKTALGSLYEK